MKQPGRMLGLFSFQGGEDAYKDVGWLGCCSAGAGRLFQWRRLERPTRQRPCRLRELLPDRSPAVYGQPRQLRRLRRGK